MHTENSRAAVGDTGPMTGIRAARPDDAAAIADVLVAAFLEDPGAVIFEPDAERRVAILPSFFGAWVRAAIADGGDLVVPSGAAVTGVASWFGPARYGPSDEALEAAGWREVLATFGDSAAARMVAMTDALERQHARLAPWPHLRLDFFGVVPAAQGTGLGSALIEHGHARADAMGLPCYLETFTERNVAFYRRRGYDVVEWYEVGDGVPIAALERQPSGGMNRR
jgi:GNAT superfamily N-acetyltransferase